MAGISSVAILRDIQTLFDVGTASGMTDRQLLERFANRRDVAADAAFEVLILRHGPMVLRVCRNMLRDEADVADAFQATFLVLVRRRETLRAIESVGGWIYGVACRVAARARVDAARRQKVEQRAALRVVEAVSPAEEFSMSRDFGPAIQEEVRCLPEKYRAVVVLCYWQSLTHGQAAAQLGCPLGTVRSRLARARQASAPAAHASRPRAACRARDHRSRWFHRLFFNAFRRAAGPRETNTPGFSRRGFGRSTFLPCVGHNCVPGPTSALEHGDDQDQNRCRGVGPGQLAGNRYGHRPLQRESGPELRSRHCLSHPVLNCPRIRRGLPSCT